MKIRVKSSGDVFDVDNHWLLTILGSAGIIEVVKPPAVGKPPCDPKWVIGASMLKGEPTLEMRCSCGARDTFFDVKKPVTVHNSTVPDAVLRDYLRKRSNYSAA